MFIVGYDQGHIFSIVYGEKAFEELYIHELTHEMKGWCLNNGYDLSSINPSGEMYERWVNLIFQGLEYELSTQMEQLENDLKIYVDDQNLIIDGLDESTYQKQSA